MNSLSEKLYYLLLPLIYVKFLFVDYWYSLTSFEMSYLSVIAWGLHGLAFAGIVYMKRSAFLGCIRQVIL